MKMMRPGTVKPLLLLPMAGKIQADFRTTNTNMECANRKDAKRMEKMPC